MTPDTSDGLPVVGAGARLLGVRVPPDPHADVRPDRARRVRPGGGGMSVVADDWADMPPWLLPEREPFCGTSKRGAVYRTGAETFCAPLRLRPDRPPHHLVEPWASMHVAEFQSALGRTRAGWEAV